jgi:hypothetical protein
MTLHGLRLTCLLLPALLASRALAEEPRPLPDTLSYTFEDQLVDANQRSSDLELLRVRTRRARESLLRIREHFIPELYKSAEDL